MGARLRRSLPGDVRVRRRRARQRTASSWRAIASASSRSTCRARPGASASPRRCPALARRRRRGHRDRPRRASPLHDLPLRRPRAAHDPPGGSQAAARHGADPRDGRHGERPRLLAPVLPALRRRGWARLAGVAGDRGRVAGDAARRAAGRREAANGRRRADRRAPVGRVRLEPDRRVARRVGAARADDVQHRVRRRRAARAATSSSTRTSSPGRSRPTTGRSGSRTRGSFPPSTAPSP